MKVSRLENFTLGWIIGNFSPTLHKTKDFEISVKHFSSGDFEPEHYQKIAQEITVIISGEALLGGIKVVAGDIVEIAPLEVAGFKALTDVSLVAIKFPSIPNDKVIP